MDPLPDDDDPRITGRFVREIADWPASLTLVGVVHEHPASVHRVRRVLETSEPDVLALELPPLSISTYKRYARDDQVPPATGGEMSAAIQSAPTAEVLGIDGPSTSYFRAIVSRLLKRRDPILARKVLGAFASVSKAVLESRLRAGITPRRPGVDFQIGREDSPTDQAQHERQHIQKSRALLDSLRDNRTKAALQVENATREGHMVETLTSRCGERDSVAVVGVHHIEGLARRLEGRTPLAG